MKKNLKYALHQGGFMFILSFVSVNLITPLLLGDLPVPNPLVIVIFTLSLGFVRGLSAYFYKKNVVEDERLLAFKQKAQAIWFNVMIVLIILIPELVIIYSNRVGNPEVLLDGQLIGLDQIASTFLAVACWFVLIGLVGGAITQKILMKSNEK